MLLTYDRAVNECVLPATEGKRGDPRPPAFARRCGFDFDHSLQGEVEALEHVEPRRLVRATVDPHVDRAALAQQITREGQQHRALEESIGRWGTAGGTNGRLS
ncbi:hypothetical protein OG520_01225 [Streptomyces sp. NBC_00984]|uniref:hypothetical protein n=1 Tax=Streptomyces sp. NBC_00984 TaxID=2903700 RepID=UPI003866BB5F|nr:hypothetical protein OG520_01225 [Streptomyces sp. NBC_00984]